MSTVTLGFNPEVDEYEDIRALLDSVYGMTETGPVSPSVEPEETETVLPNGWTRKKMHNYLANVKPDGRKALRIIAENAPDIGFTEVQEEMGYGPEGATVYGGMMTTLKHAANRTRGVKDKPFTQDYSTRTYSINEKVAALVIEVLDEMES